jgi:hypothetical protein
MADLRISTNLPATRPETGAERNEAVRAAQRAFFEAAMKRTPLQSLPAASAAAAPAQPPASPRVDKFVFDPDNPPEHPLRPGSLVDIRV